MRSKPYHILLIEDHFDTAAVVKKLLERFGHRVQHAGTCGEARQLFAAHSFELLLIDIGLPDCDGCDFFQELQAIRKVPGIAITAHGMARDVQRSRQAGFIAHITKPNVFDELMKLTNTLDLSTSNVSWPADGAAHNGK